MWQGAAAALATGMILLWTHPAAAAPAGMNTASQPPKKIVTTLGLGDPLAHPMTASLAPRQTTLDMTATAYGPTAQDNYPYGATDYYGAPLRIGDVAVDPSVIPLGSKLRICGYHTSLLPGSCLTATANDTGSAIRGLHVDIYLDGSESQVSMFGIQPVSVTVIRSGW